MPRKANLGRAEILHKATREFWSRGFRAASIDSLVKEIGTTRFSLYREFGGKDGLFESVLDHYAAKVVTQALRPMTDSDDGVESIEKYFEILIERQDRIGNGCLMTNTMAELGPEHEGARERTRAHFNRVTRAFEAALRRARARGELRPEIEDVAAKALELATFAQGVWICARSRVGAGTLRASVATMIGSLRP